MSDSKDEDARFNETVKRMLATPPKKHVSGAQERRQAAKAKVAPPQRKRAMRVAKDARAKD